MKNSKIYIQTLHRIDISHRLKHQGPVQLSGYVVGHPICLSNALSAWVSGGPHFLKGWEENVPV